jgi:hypothetical protein
MWPWVGEEPNGDLNGLIHAGRLRRRAGLHGADALVPKTSGLEVYISQWKKSQVVTARLLSREPSLWRNS